MSVFRVRTVVAGAPAVVSTTAVSVTVPGVAGAAPVALR
jgi:hypothetical protein